MHNSNGTDLVYNEKTGYIGAYGGEPLLWGVLSPLVNGNVDEVADWKTFQTDWACCGWNYPGDWPVTADWNAATQKRAWELQKHAVPATARVHV